MPHIVIISSSVRTGRKSHRVALFFQEFITSQNLGTAEIVDLKKYNFPLFEERLKFQEQPLPAAIEYATKIKDADGVIIVTPEYNGGSPASIINAIDLLVDEWHHKPVAISTASAGVFGGSQVITSLQFKLWKIKALTVTATFPVPKLEEAFSEDGVPSDPEATNKRAKIFVNELIWFIESFRKTQ